MPKSLSEYIDWLEGRPQLLWPKPPVTSPLNASPFLKPLPEVRGVVWCIYGTLLNIHDGRLHHLHPQSLRNELALQKTIDEFNMWNSMSRKPGQPWEYMLQQYEKARDELQMVGTKNKGDVPEVDSVKLWFKLVDRLLRNEYSYDEAFYGEPDELALKVAFFFHSMLQGVATNANVTLTLQRLTNAGIRQGLLDDAQSFTLKSLMHQLQKDDPALRLGDVISSDLVALSFQLGIRKPSETLFAVSAEQFRRIGLEPRQVLYVSHRLHDDLAIARRFGFRTALYAGDAQSCRVEAADLKNQEIKPDRLLTDVSQIASILGV
jgi:FMN phosphatase YigB (HAD superfamily)